MSREKLETLRRLLLDMNGVLVAYSGGVDSAFLLKVAKDVLGDRAVAATALSESYAGREFEEGRELARRLGVRQILVETREMDRPGYVENSPDRCYHCKDELFRRLKPVADREGLEIIVYGEIADDASDHRPGARAAREHRVRAPLAEAGLGKLEIRRLSKELGLPTWDKPSMACLSSRIPYGNAVTPDKLRRIEAAEEVLRGLGVRQVRVRHHGDLARIEVGPSDLEELVRSPIRELLHERLQALGYAYVTLDLKGYRSGSLNEVVLGRGLGSRTTEDSG
jgi:uncharacterized protein